MKRTYLAIFAFAKPQKEHLKVIDVIRGAAVNGDFKQFPAAGGMAFLFDSEKLPWHLDFDRILLDGDSRMIVEVGENTAISGFGAAAGWLNVRRPRRG